MSEIIFENRLEFIESLFLDCDEINLAVSFVRNSGVNILRPLYLESLKNNINCKLIVDTKQRISEKNALKILVNDGFVVKNYIGNGSFHPKIWLFKKQNNWFAIIGSMNISLGGLNSNIEAIAILDDKEALVAKEWFDCIWNNPQKVSILNLEMISQLSTPIKFVYSSKGPESSILQESDLDLSNLPNSEIINFIKEWTHDTKKESPGPSMRKTGWIFRPYHGEFNQEKLEELQLVLENMFKDDSIQFELNEANAETIIKESNITYSRRTHKTSYRDLLMKQQINYLSKLYLIKKIDNRTWNKIRLTPLGRAYKSASKEKLINYLERAIINYDWFGINIYDFTKSFLKIIPDNKISYEEFFIFLRHGGVDEYKLSSPEDLVRLVLSYRNLSKDEKEEIIEKMEKWIKDSDNSRSKTSLINMKNNWSPGIFNDLLQCKDFKNDGEYLKLNE